MDADEVQMAVTGEAIDDGPGGADVIDNGHDVHVTDDVAAVRELVLAAHPDVVPELVGGATVADIIASVEPARAAYARLAESIRGQEPQPSIAVPAGGGATLVTDPDRLPPSEKIRRGIAAITYR